MRAACAIGFALGIAAVPANGQHHDHAQHAPAAAAETQVDVKRSQPTRKPAPASPAPLPAPSADARAAAFPDLGHMDMTGHMDEDPFIATLAFDRLEWLHTSRQQALGWEIQGWAGGLERRVWLRSEGERPGGGATHGDVELLWGRPTGPWWDVLVGVRHDFGEGPARSWLAAGVQGMAPYKFEVAATAYVGARGRLAARVEAEYDLLLTNRLILQPRAGANLYSKDDPGRGVGSGLGTAEFGLRLRYELHRQFAPYIGVAWSHSFGDTARFAADRGEPRSEHSWVAGLHFWF